MNRFILSSLAALSLGVASLGVSHAADIHEHTIKFASANNKGHPQVMGMEKFAELVAEKSGNKIHVRLFPGGVLGGDLEVVSALQGGTVEMTVLPCRADTTSRSPPSTPPGNRRT